jgi:hypothetical protein
MPRRAAARRRVLLCALRRVLLCALLLAVCGVAAQSESPPAEAQKARRSVTSVAPVARRGRC